MLIYNYIKRYKEKNMEIAQMVKEIRLKREGSSKIIERIERNFDSIIDKIIASIYYTPSQSYGLLIKDYIKAFFNAWEAQDVDGYTEEFGNYKVKVHVGNGKRVKLKQVIPGENVTTYICVSFDYAQGKVVIYALPAKIVLANIGIRPDHGNEVIGITHEYTANILISNIKDYIIEEGIR